MAMRGEAAQALSPWPATKRSHVGLDPRLVDEDQTRRIEATLPRLPALAATGNVGSSLLKSEQRFFEAQALAPQEHPDRIVRDHHPACGQLVLQPMQRQIRSLVDPLYDEGPMRLQNPLAVSAHLARRNRAGGSLTLRSLYTEETATPKRDATARQLSPVPTASTTRHEDRSKGLAQSYAGLRPASILNHKPASWGILRFSQGTKCSS